MKKLIFLLAFTVGFAFTVNAQGSLVESLTLATGTVDGYGTTLDIYSPYLGPYWDYSIQLKSTFYGVGDSSSWNVVSYQTNDPAQSVWTTMTETTLDDTIQTVTDDSGVILEVSDFKGLWIKHTITSMGLDTVTITPYAVKKLKRTIE